MKKAEYIVDAKNDETTEREISAFADIKYRLPYIGAYVVEATPRRARHLRNVAGIKAVRATSHVSLSFITIG
ncbi:MAG: hypothetical protein FWB74_05825 [Defluviitaleaceae bacterium]|nr:hypothetical protein [Defluviitaleaceae bacterium]